MIRFGILGFGLHAVKRVTPAYALAKHCTVTALSRRDLSEAQASAARHNIAHAFASGKELCSSPEVDAVYVASPDAFHCRDVLTALEHSKPVLCEKPMAMNGAEARRMVEAAERAGLLLGVGQVYRFERSVGRMMEVVRAGTIGRPLFARAEFSYPGLSHPRQWLRDPSLACGGPIADAGVHCLDTLRFILQDEVESVQTTAAYDDPSSPLETSATINLRFRGGAAADINVSVLTGYATPVEVVGERGWVRAENCFVIDRPVELVVNAGGAEAREMLNNSDAFARQLDAFALALEGGEPFPVPGAEGLRNQLILDAIYESASTRQAVAVNPLHPSKASHVPPGLPRESTS